MFSPKSYKDKKPTVFLFRKEGQDIGGTIVPPATTSNHLVGHASDMNLETPRGWCNSICLAAENNSYAKCFTDKEMILKNVIYLFTKYHRLWSIVYGS